MFPIKKIAQSFVDAEIPAASGASFNFLICVSISNIDLSCVLFVYFHPEDWHENIICDVGKSQA